MTQISERLQPCLLASASTCLESTKHHSIPSAPLFLVASKINETAACKAPPITSVLQFNMTFMSQTQRPANDQLAAPQPDESIAWVFLGSEPLIMEQQPDQIQSFTHNNSLFCALLFVSQMMVKHPSPVRFIARPDKSVSGIVIEDLTRGFVKLVFPVSCNALASETAAVFLSWLSSCLRFKRKPFP